MLHKRILGLSMLFVMVLLVGCGANNYASYDSDDGAPSSEVSQSSAGSGRAYGDDGEERAAGEQHIIWTAEIGLDVESMDETLSELRAVVRQSGGYIAQSSVYGSEENRRSELTLRVPTDNMGDILEQIEALGKQTYSNTGSNDVTLQYVDLEARIRNLQRQEERLLDILEQAETIEEILQMEQELGRVRAELEAKTAEFRYLSDRVNYATVHVSLRQTSTASPTITATGLKGVWQRGVAGLINSVNSLVAGIGNFLVFLLTALPYLLLFVAVGIPVSMLVRKLGGKRPQTPDV